MKFNDSHRDTETQRGNGGIWFFWFFLLALCVASNMAWAEDVSISAALSSETTTVGEPVELYITVEGTQKVTAPQIRVEGLSIQYNGESKQFQMVNTEITRSVKHTYTLLAQKEGTFTIPALAIDAGGKKLFTQPLTLTVSNAPGGGNAGTQENPFVIAEWVLPKSAAYVGEAIPVELRLYVGTGIQCQLPQMPTISGDGFTVAKLPKPLVNKVTREGRQYDMAVFRTAITAVKAGKLILPATEINTVMVLPQKRGQRPRFPNGFPDMFNDPFFSGAFAQQKQVAIRPEPVEMEIKALPAEGKPKDFSGAVGQFTMETKAAPLRVRAGDPVTITAVVKGIGSFDRMNAPAVAEEPGWRIYPPSGKFQADDEVGISGAKTFEIAAIPETAKSALPPVTFSFFNPSTEQYETLTADRLALSVENAPASAPAPVVVAATTPPTTPAATPAPKPSDIQYIRVDAGSWGASFDPVWRTRDFWLAQLVPFSALLALCGWQWCRVRQSDGAARRAAALRQARAEAFRVLRQEKTPTEAFYSAAIRVIQLETALGNGGVEPGAVDAAAACGSRPLDCETAEGIRRVFAVHDELRYAGVGASGGSSLHPDQRERVLQILAQFETSHA